VGSVHGMKTQWKLYLDWTKDHREYIYIYIILIFYKS